MRNIVLSLTGVGNKVYWYGEKINSVESQNHWCLSKMHFIAGRRILKVSLQQQIQ